MKKSSMIAIVLLMSSMNNVFPMQQTVRIEKRVTEVRRAHRIAGRAVRMVNNAKNDIQLDFNATGSIAPLTKLNAGQVILFCDRNGQQKLSLELARFLKNKEKLTERIAKRGRYGTVRRVLNFDDVDSSEEF